MELHDRGCLSAGVPRRERRGDRRNAALGRRGCGARVERSRTRGGGCAVGGVVRVLDCAPRVHPRLARVARDADCRAGVVVRGHGAARGGGVAGAEAAGASGLRDHRLSSLFFPQLFFSRCPALLTYRRSPPSKIFFPCLFVIVAVRIIYSNLSSWEGWGTASFSFCATTVPLIRINFRAPTLLITPICYPAAKNVRVVQKGVWRTVEQTGHFCGQRHKRNLTYSTKHVPLGKRCVIRRGVVEK
ncbi:hypothetical protein DFJ73DRAFT_948030 [Zopfochytrium polystomum]|nr:hypothetical protein DFJ73DRAFT_948030 [Zopfochytrium polystomum]